MTEFTIKLLQYIINVYLELLAELVEQIIQTSKAL